MPKLADIYSLHALIIDEIIKLFDKSVWSLWSVRDVIRKVELVRLGSYLHERNCKLKEWVLEPT